MNEAHLRILRMIGTLRARAPTEHDGEEHSGEGEFRLQVACVVVGVERQRTAGLLFYTYYNLVTGQI
jgi:hypothetical protein